MNKVGYSNIGTDEHNVHNKNNSIILDQNLFNRQNEEKYVSRDIRRVSKAVKCVITEATK